MHHDNPQFAKADVEELEWPKLWPQPHWTTLRWTSSAIRNSNSTSVSDLNKALVAEIYTPKHQNVVEFQKGGGYNKNKSGEHIGKKIGVVMVKLHKLHWLCVYLDFV